MIKDKNMIKKKKLLIIFSIIAFLIIFCSCLNWRKPYNKSGCYNTPETVFPAHMDSVVQNCLGYMYIEKDNKCSDDLSLDSKCGDIFIYDTNRYEKIVSKVDAYITYGKNIYVIGQLAVSALTGDDNKKHIFYHEQVNGEEISVQINSLEDAPKYMVINFETSDMILYKDYPEMVDGDREIFYALERR